MERIDPTRIGERARAAWSRVRGAPLTRRRVALAGGLVVALAWGLWERCGVAGCPNVDRLVAYQPGGASVLLDREGRPFADLSPVRREVVPLDSLPPYVAEAFVAVEDKRFLDHGGVDWRRVGGALLANLSAGGVVEGFSTITMQLARNIFPDRLPGQKRTLKRKVLEVRVAREIEDEFDKREILELYLNHIYFGGGAYGIEAAAHHWFGKDASELELHEAALLAALPKGPALYDPRTHAERARERRDLVLALMERQGRIAPGEAESARGRRLGVLREPPRPRGAEVPPAPYFVEATRRWLEQRFGEEIYTSTLRIHTTLDRTAQEAAEAELARQLRSIERGEHGRFRGARYRADAAPGASTGYLQGAAVVVDAGSGDVLALVGGRDFEQSRFDRATRARRQPGSAFKPFVFAAALSEGYAASQHIADAPLRMELPGGEVWEPKNASGEFEGTVTLREALVRSKNVPAVRLSEVVGRGSVARLARAAGIESAVPDLPSMALGTGAVSPLELTAAYTAFAREGVAARPRLVLRIEDEDGEVVWESEPERRRVLDPAVAFLVTDILSDAVRRGTGTAVRAVGFRGAAAGKTGTTDGGTDAWFVGYTPERVATVWIGFDDPRPIVAGATGGELAAPVWGRIMRRLYRERGAPAAWRAPEAVVERRVDPATGLVLAEGCRPENGRADTELFVAGSEPASVCPRGREVEGEPGLFDRFVARVGSLWGRATGWLASHFGREEPLAPPSARDRYLGTPRLPRVDELPTPVLEPELYEPPRLEDRILIPDVPPLDAETLLARPPRADSAAVPDSAPAPDTVVVPDTVAGG